jgi:hypothetical protein
MGGGCKIWFLITPEFWPLLHDAVENKPYKF